MLDVNFLFLYLRTVTQVPVAQVDHGFSYAKVIGSIPREV